MITWWRKRRRESAERLRVAQEARRRAEARLREAHSDFVVPMSEMRHKNHVLDAVFRVAGQDSRGEERA